MIQRPDQMTPGRPAGVDHPLELQAGDHIGSAAVLVLRELPGIEHVHSGGNNDRSYLETLLGLPVIKYNTFALAGFHTLLTDPDPVLVQTQIHVD